MKQHTFHYKKRFPLESKAALPELTLVYHTYGTLNTEKSNVIWVCHALTASSDVFSWWQGLFGVNDYFNPQNYFIICVNNIGSCYGSTGPLSIHPDLKTPYYAYFPSLSIKDIANSLELLRRHLGITEIHTLIGGSLGGQIALEWTLLQAVQPRHLILVATNARHSPWGIAFNESQRMAIKADRTYYANIAEGGAKGLSAARSIALLSYRTYQTYALTQKDNRDEKTKDFHAAAYQRYQGEKLVKRFNAYSYICLLDAMDSHNLVRGRNTSLREILKKIYARTLVVSINSDFLFHPDEQKLLAEYIPGASYAGIDSIYGHDGFLIETKELEAAIRFFFEAGKAGEKVVENEKQIRHSLKEQLCQKN